ncbi:MAG: GrpB family protein, partial [Chloroflexota bacterium]|nr:GrpB family protein [Chloroflexota bacterium]
FRDYVRAHADAAAKYEELKLELAMRYRDDREGYVEAKGPFIWTTMAAATEWSQRTGWEPGRAPPDPRAPAHRECDRVQAEFV